MQSWIETKEDERSQRTNLQISKIQKQEKPQIGTSTRPDRSFCNHGAACWGNDWGTLAMGVQGIKSSQCDVRFLHAILNKFVETSSVAPDRHAWYQAGHVREMLDTSGWCRSGQHEPREVPREGALPIDAHDDKGHGGVWHRRQLQASQSRYMLYVSGFRVCKPSCYDVRLQAAAPS